MIGLLLSGGDVFAVTTTRAQLPLLLAQASNLSTITLSQAVETDSAFTILPFQGATLVPVAQAVETDSAFTVTVKVNLNQTIPLDIASELDSAFGMTVFAPVAAFITVDMATETDEAFSVTYHKTFMTPVTFPLEPEIAPLVVGTVTLTPVEVE